MSSTFLNEKDHALLPLLPTTNPTPSLRSTTTTTLEDIYDFITDSLRVVTALTQVLCTIAVVIWVGELLGDALTGRESYHIIDAVTAVYLVGAIATMQLLQGMYYWLEAIANVKKITETLLVSAGERREPDEDALRALGVVGGRDRFEEVEEVVWFVGGRDVFEEHGA